MLTPSQELLAILPYYPIEIDNRVYFPTHVGHPAGSFRVGKLGDAVWYVDIRSRKPYYRSLAELQHRAFPVDREKLQDELDFLARDEYKAVPIHFHGELHPVVLVTRAARGVVDGLTNPEITTIGVTTKNTPLDATAGSVKVAAALVQNKWFKGFLRLPLILEETIYK